MTVKTIASSARVYRYDPAYVGRSNTQRVYICRHDGRDQECLMQVAETIEYNAQMERAAYILGLLQRRSDELETEYAKVKTDPDKLLNYILFFPELVETFQCEESGQRQINVLAFRFVPLVEDLLPIGRFVRKDKMRVDLRTSVWMMGKGLKLLDFVHSNGFSIGLVNDVNFMIERNKHYVMFFDWSQASIYDEEEVPTDISCREITSLAKVVIDALEGDIRTEMFPEEKDENAQYEELRSYLLFLARGNETNARTAMQRFYKIAHSIWKHEYYPFTCYPRSQTRR